MKNLTFIIAAMVLGMLVLFLCDMREAEALPPPSYLDERVAQLEADVAALDTRCDGLRDLIIDLAMALDTKIALNSATISLNSGRINSNETEILLNAAHIEINAQKITDLENQNH